MVYWISYYILKILSALFFPFTIQGRKHIPREGGFIFASNHLSNIDPLLIGLSVQRRISYMGKESLFANKFLGAFLRQVGTFPIKRESADIGALREALRRLRRGSPLVVFPEGARAGSRKVLRRDGSAYSGIGFLAAKSGVPVIPVRISGSDKVLPPGARWFRRHPIRLIFGPPLLFSPRDSYPRIAETIMDRVATMSLSPKTSSR